MQIAIELPDELGKQLLEMPNMQLFVQNAVEKMLLEEKKRQSAHELLVEHQKSIPKNNNDAISPITRSLVGILKGSNVDINDYKKHLEEKHL